MTPDQVKNLFGHCPELQHLSLISSSPLDWNDFHRGVQGLRDLLGLSLRARIFHFSSPAAFDQVMTTIETGRNRRLT